MPGVRTTVSHVSDAATGAGGFQGGAVLVARLVSDAPAFAVLVARLVSGASALPGLGVGAPVLSAAASTRPATPWAAPGGAHDAHANTATRVSPRNERMRRRLFYVLR